MKRTFAIIIVLVAQILTLAPVRAQVDLPAALVGTWEGEVPFGRRNDGDRRRTLVITSVEQTQNGWTVDARYGTFGQRLGRPRAVLQVVGADVLLTVRTTGGVEMSLKLEEGKYLAGPYHGTGRAQAWSIRFEKTQ